MPPFCGGVPNPDFAFRNLLFLLAMSPRAIVANVMEARDEMFVRPDVLPVAPHGTRALTASKAHSAPAVFECVAEIAVEPFARKTQTLAEAFSACIASPKHRAGGHHARTSR